MLESQPESIDARHRIHRIGRYVLHRVRAVRPRLRTYLTKGIPMSFDLILGAVTALGLLGYLGFVLIRPERF